jgi:hypothetical protein
VLGAEGFEGGVGDVVEAGLVVGGLAHGNVTRLAWAAVLRQGLIGGGSLQWGGTDRSTSGSVEASHTRGRHEPANRRAEGRLALKAWG